MANQAGSSTWMQNMAPQCEYFKSPKSPKFLLKMCQILFSFLQACSWQVRRRFLQKPPCRSMSLLIIRQGGSFCELVHTLEILTHLKFWHNWNFDTLEIFTPSSWPRLKDWRNQRVGIGLRSKKFQLVWSSQQIESRLFSFIFLSINRMGWDNWRSPQVVMQRLTDGYLETTKHVGYQDSSVQGDSPILKVLGTENFI